MKRNLIKMKILCLFLIITIGSSLQHIVAQKSDTVYTKAEVDKIKRQNMDSISMIYTDSIKKINKKLNDKNSENDTVEKTTVNNLIIAIAFFLIMATLIVYFFRHLRIHNQRIGYQSIKLIGLILIFPGICILSIVGGSKILSGQTLAVLLGTIAGYVLSRDDDSKEPAKPKEEPEPSLEELLRNKAELEAKIKKIQDKKPS